jgi:nucleoside-diphosphate-sugar epimerase
MKVFILGGTGLIGGAVTRELVSAGHQVRGLCRSPQSGARLTELGAEPVHGDLSRPVLWQENLLWADVLIHSAASFCDRMAAIDDAVVRAVIAAGRIRKTPLRVIYTGGAWLYGETGDRVAVEDHPLIPVDAFAWMARNARQLERAPGLDTAILHPAQVWHTGGGAFDRMLDLARRRLPIEIHGGLNVRWPLVHRDDLARAYRLLAERPGVTGSFNIAGEEGTPLRRIFHEIVKATGHDGSYIVRSRDWVRRTRGSLAEGPALDQQMSSAKAREVLGWQPRHTDFAATAFGTSHRLCA